jgi:hypothetical protein
MRRPSSGRRPIDIDAVTGSCAGCGRRSVEPAGRGRLLQGGGGCRGAVGPRRAHDAARASALVRGATPGRLSLATATTSAAPSTSPASRPTRGLGEVVVSELVRAAARESCAIHEAHSTPSSESGVDRSAPRWRPYSRKRRWRRREWHSRVRSATKSRPLLPRVLRAHLVPLRPGQDARRRGGFDARDPHSMLGA